MIRGRAGARLVHGSWAQCKPAPKRMWGRPVGQLALEFTGLSCTGAAAAATTRLVQRQTAVRNPGALPSPGGVGAFVMACMALAAVPRAAASV